MKLSMQILKRFFVQKSQITAVDVMNGDRVLTGVRLAEIPGGAPELLDVLSDGAGGTMLVNGADRIALPDLAPETALNLVLDAFESYNAWERELYVALGSGGSLQDLLDIAHRMFARPMFIKASSGHIRAITAGYPSSVHPLWDRFQYAAQTGTVERESSLFVSADPEYSAVFAQKKTEIVRSPLYGGMVLRVNVWQAEQWVYEIVVFANGAPFDGCDVHLMDTLLEVMNCYVKANAGRYRSFSDLQDFFRELLRTGHSGNANFLLIYQSAGWKPSDELTSIAIGSVTGQDTPALGMLRDRLQQELRGAIVLQSEGHLACIANTALYGGYRTLLERLETLIPSDTFTWGVSYEFTGLDRIPKYMSYAVRAQQEAKAAGKARLTMYDSACGWIVQRLKESGQDAELIHPGVVRLMEQDAGGKGKLCATLFEYLLCGGNFTDTAQRLGIHRNSLIYRMGKIQEIVGSDLNAPAGRKLMLYSFLLLGY